MYYQQFENKNEIQTAIVQHLRNIGIKQRTKKPTIKQNDKPLMENRIFKTDLRLLETCEFFIEDENITINVPRFVHEACNLIKKNLQVEGLFRKAGSNARQKNIRENLDKNNILNPESHVIDIANILKTFFRDLPEPLVPYMFHDTFLHCLRLEKEKIKDTVLLICLLLPEIHLQTLKYFMTFLNDVQSYSSFNKMTTTNLSIVITPNIMPIDAHQMKISYLTNQRLTHHVQVVELLIKYSNEIGFVPDFIAAKLISNTHTLSDGLNQRDEDKRKKKKRRSGSLTRMFNGLKKIVSGKNTTDDEILDEMQSSTESVITAPLLTKSNKRKAVDVTGLSNKKKRGVLQLLPQNSALGNTPFVTPKRRFERTPITAFERCNSELKQPLSTTNNQKKAKRSSLEGESSKHAIGSTRIERRWSMINQISAWGKKKKATENSFTNISKTNDIENMTNATETFPEDDTEFISIRKSEYEEIKNRVSAIENRLSKEFQDVPIAVDPSGTSISLTDAASDVQNQYEKTLEEVESLNNTSTEQLATRLSRELKIRRNSEAKIIRSPSARKIGTIRRRSRELNRKLNNQIIRNFSWHNESTPPVKPPRTGVLRRGRPNTLYTGLPNPSPLRQTQLTENVSSPIQINIATVNLNNCNNMLEENTCTQWVGGEAFFQSTTSPFTSQTVTTNTVPSRASIARLRSQNAGMVMAKAKLFNELVEPTTNHSNVHQNDSKNAASKTCKSTLRRKSKSPSNNKLKKKYVSYVTINANNLEIKTQASNVNKENDTSECDNLFTPSKTSLTPLKDSNRLNIHKVHSPKLSPRLTTPRIKKSLHNKSPRHFIRTPQSSVLERNLRTPMKANHALNCNSYNSGMTPNQNKKINMKRYSPKMCSQKSTAF